MKAHSQFHWISYFLVSDSYQDDYDYVTKTMKSQLRRLHGFL